LVAVLVAILVVGGAIAIAISRVGCGVVSGGPAITGCTSFKLDSIDDHLIDWSTIDMAIWRGGVVRWNILWVSLTRSRVVVVSIVSITVTTITISAVVTVSLSSTIIVASVIELGQTKVCGSKGRRWCLAVSGMLEASECVLELPEQHSEIQQYQKCFSNLRIWKPYERLSPGL